MTRVPFHRRVFLWVIVVTFFVLAPAVVFYTSGYRWNAKKGIIERNGTLILDSQPPGATILLNGEALTMRTPVTLQNTAPGTYRIRLEFPGYASWEKTLDVRPSLVTFVNDVRLWRNGTPSAVSDRPVAAIAVSPNGRTLATVEENENGVRMLVFRDVSITGDISFDPASTAVTRFGFGATAPTGTVGIVWNDAGNDLLVSDDGGREWLGSRNASAENALLLPQGVWRWNDGTLVGVRETTNGSRVEQSIVTPRTGATQLTSLPSGVIDQDDTFAVESTNGTSRLSVVERGRSGRRFELPSGSWTIADREGDWLFLTDGNEWLGFDPSDAEAASIRIPVETDASFLRRGRETSFLSYGGGELWEGTLGEAPDLLLRSSQPIVGAAWHRDGNYAFYATGRDIVAMGLDARDGRSRNTLATFDVVSGFAVIEGSLYVAGERSGTRGIWHMTIE